MFIAVRAHGAGRPQNMVGEIGRHLAERDGYIKMLHSVARWGLR